MNFWTRETLFQTAFHHPWLLMLIPAAALFIGLCAISRSDALGTQESPSDLYCRGGYKTPFLAGALLGAAFGLVVSGSLIYASYLNGNLNMVASDPGRVVSVVREAGAYHCDDLLSSLQSAFAAQHGYLPQGGFKRWKRAVDLCRNRHRIAASLTPDADHSVADASAQSVARSLIADIQARPEGRRD